MALDVDERVTGADQEVWFGEWVSQDIRALRAYTNFHQLTGMTQDGLLRQLKEKYMTGLAPGTQRAVAGKWHQALDGAKRAVPCPLYLDPVPGNDIAVGGAVGEVTQPAAAVDIVNEPARGLPEAGSAGTAGTPARDGGPRPGSGELIPRPSSTSTRTERVDSAEVRTEHAGVDNRGVAPVHEPGRQSTEVRTPERGGGIPFRGVTETVVEEIRRGTQRAEAAMEAEEADLATEAALRASSLRGPEQRRTQTEGHEGLARALQKVATAVQVGTQERGDLTNCLATQREDLRHIGAELTRGMGQIAAEVHREVAEVALCLRDHQAEMTGVLELVQGRIDSLVEGGGRSQSAIAGGGPLLAIQETPRLGHRPQPLHSTIRNQGGPDVGGLGLQRLLPSTEPMRGREAGASWATRGGRRTPPLRDTSHTSDGRRLDGSQGVERDYRVPKDLLISVLPYDGGDQLKEGSWDHWRQELSRRLKGHPSLSEAQLCSLLHQKLSGEAGRVIDKIDEQARPGTDVSSTEYWHALNRHFNTGDRLQRSEEEVHALEYREAEPFTDFSKLLKAKLRQAFPTEAAKQEQQGLFVLRRVLKGTPLGTVMTLYTSLNKRADLQEVLEHLNLQDDRGPARAERGGAGPGRPRVLAGIALSAATHDVYAPGEEEACETEAALAGAAVTATGRGQSRNNQTNKRGGRNRTFRGRGRGTYKGQSRDVGDQQPIPISSPAPEAPAGAPGSQPESLRDILRDMGRRVDEIADRQVQCEDRLGDKVVAQVDRRLQEQYQRLTSSRGRGRPGYPTQGNRGGYTRAPTPGATGVPPAGRYQVGMRQPGIRCFRCDKEGHYARNCPLRNCHYCDDCLDVLYQQGAFSVPDYCVTCSPGEEERDERSLVATQRESGSGNW